MILYILLAVAVAIVALLVIASMQPCDFRVERSATIAAPPVEAFSRVNDLHEFQTWSPWAKIDPNCQTTFEGPSAGPGARFSWSGSSKVGQGRMTVTDSRANELVRLKLEFFKPFTATNTAEFTFKASGDQTVVTWSMSGKNNFMSKVMRVFINCDKMIGRSFEEGLGNLKTLAEAARNKATA
jgi:hypothetical protein